MINYNINDNIKLVIGIPTINSYKYIYNSLQRVVSEINLLPQNINTELVVCLNGTNNAEQSAYEINKFMDDYAHIKIHFIKLDIPGKNSALNKIIEYAKSMNSDIIHLFDDDIHLKEGSLYVDIRELINKQKKSEVPVLVGSNFVGIKKNYSDFLKTEKHYLKALKCFILHKIFIIPFLMTSDRPRFCVGGSLGAFTSTFPNYPDDDTGIADDGFIGNYYALKVKDQFLTNGMNNIVKPHESIVYFNIASSLREWIKQQVRIFVGVYYSYIYFQNEMDFFSDFFSWAYSIGKDFRRKGPFLGLVNSFLHLFLRLFQKIVLIESLKVIRNNDIPTWNIATTSKGNIYE